MTPRTARSGDRRAAAGRGPMRLGCIVLAVLAACVPATAKNANETGAVMTTSEGVSVRRLGEPSPHLTYHGTSGRDFVDPSPIVLWGRTQPAAVLHLEVETRGRRAVQRIAPVDRSVKLPGFPVTYKIEVPADATSEEVADSLDTRALIAADVDGDGVQELVATRRQGGVSLHGARGQHTEYPSPAGAAAGKKYRRLLAHSMSVGGRDVVYVLSVLDAPGWADRNLLLRVDGGGITRVRPEGLDQARILALGAIQRPGSPDLDELLVLTAEGERDASLGRYRPDGKAIDRPRKMYVRPSRECAFRFVPRSTKAVLEVDGGVLVISPEKPVNWIQEIKVREKVDPGDLDIAFVAELEGDPKMVYSAGDALWAVNHDRTCFAPAGGGRWTPLPKPGPYLHVPAPAGEKLWFVWKAEGGKLLAVSSGERGTRRLTHEEWGRAADRYLPQDEAEAFRKRRQPSLDGEHGYRDVRMKREREERNVEPVHSVEEWKRSLPRSYAEVLKYDATAHDVDVAARLEELRDDPKQAVKAPDPAGLRAFLESIQVPARTTFMVIDGLAVSSVTVQGSPMRLLETQAGGPVEFRLHDGRITAILALEKGDAEGRARPAFYEVEARLSAGR